MWSKWLNNLQYHVVVYLFFSYKKIMERLIPPAEIKRSCGLWNDLKWDHYGMVYQDNDAGGFISDSLYCGAFILVNG